MATTDRDRPAAPRTKVAPASLTALQCELRALFKSRPVNRAIAAALDRIGTRFEAVYAVLHTRLGLQLLSEEWTRPGTEVGTQVRDQVNAALWEAVSSEETRSARLSGENEQDVVVAVVMYDQDIQPSGGAAVVLRTNDRSRIAQTLVRLESVLGYLSLLMDDGKASDRRIAEHRAILPAAAAEHPLRLAHTMIAELEHRYGFETTAIGFVREDRVEVAAVSGVDELRAANPGMATIRAAMEECLDHRSIVVCADGDGLAETDDCRLHAQWSAQRHGNPVASFPLVFLDQIVAIVSVSQGAASLTRDKIVLCADEMSAYAALVPLSRTANRSLTEHAVDSARRVVAKVTGRGRRRAMLTAALAALLGGFLFFGKLPHAFTVPCVVKAADRRTISCPRSGVLAEVFVRPGDRVREGQLLAAIDANDDFLRRAEVIAEIESLDALVDQAVARREAGQVRVYEAKKRSLQAQLVILDANIAEAQIRAPQDGLILQGDLRERLGSRIEIGAQLFELARYDRAAVVLRIPEKLVLAAHAAKHARFASSARPDQTLDLDELSIAPASTVVDERNVFLGEATVAIDLAQLPPGMEGTAYVDAGPHPAFWVLTHRITDWLHINFWL